jgi:hypothetical protein
MSVTPARVGGMTSTPLVSLPICYALHVPCLFVTTAPFFYVSAEEIAMSSSRRATT